MISRFTVRFLRISMSSVLACVWLGMLCLLPLRAAATPGTDQTVALSATVQKSPPQLTIAWPAFTGATGYKVYRKAPEATSWGTVLADLPADARQYQDRTVTLAKIYEYKVERRTTSNGTGYGYLYSGIEIPLVENRGKVVLLVAGSYAADLAPELTRLQQDLVGDGWTVLRHDIAANAKPAEVRDIIKADYNADKTNVKAVFIFGHIPVLMSGYLAPDGHAARPWPADAYYGDMDGQWTDTQTSTGYKADDGVMDQNYLPSDVELAVGRVDMYDLPAFAPKTEKDLLKQYLEKDHAFRGKTYAYQLKAIVDDNFTSYGEGFSQNGWRNFATFFGAEHVSAGKWKDAVSTPYLWSYGCGGGNYQGASGVASTSDLKTVDPAIFTMLFGSYFGEWQPRDDFLRAELATSQYGLTCAWAGRPNWFFHHMALGEPISYSTKLSVNNPSSIYTPGGAMVRGIHVALMGDPTLRMHPVAPPSGVAVKAAGAGKDITWQASTESVLGYQVYRALKPEGPYTRLTGTPVTTLTYRDNSAGTNNYTYMVRAITLQVTPSGSFYNASQGAFSGEPAVLGAPTLLSPADGADAPVPVTLAWRAVDGATTYWLQVSKNADFTDLVFEQKDLTDVSQTVPANKLVVGTKYWWRVRAGVGTQFTGAWSAVWTFTAKEGEAVRYQPDVLLRNNSETDFIGDNLYNIAEAHTKRQSVPAASKATYVIKIQNDGTGEDRFTVTAPAIATGWTAKYYTALTGGTDITAQVNGDGWSTDTLVINQTKEIRVEVTPGTAVTAGAKQSIVVTVTSTTKTTQTDSGVLETTCQAGWVPKLQLFASPATACALGQSVALTAIWNGGGGPMEFKFFYYDGANWLVLRNYQSNNTTTWKPTTIGEFNLLVWARPVGSTAEWTANATIWSFRVKSGVSKVTLTANPASPQKVGTPITLTATPTGGINVEYSFYLSDGKTGWQLLCGYTTASTCTWTPLAPGSYSLLVYAREKGSKNTYDANATLWSYQIKAK